MHEKVLFLGPIFKTEIFTELYDLRFPKSKSIVFSGWSVCVFTNITQKQIIAKIQNLKITFILYVDAI